MPSTNEARIVAFVESVNRLKQVESLMSALAFDPKVVTDERFFEGLIWNTASALEMDYGFLTVSRPPYNSVKMLAFWKGDNFATPYEYDLDGTRHVTG